MNRIGIAILAATASLAFLQDSADACHRGRGHQQCPCVCQSNDDSGYRQGYSAGYQDATAVCPQYEDIYGSKSKKSAKGKRFWPFTDGGDEPVDPAGPQPNIDPQPEPLPVPEPVPGPDNPAPSPDNPPGPPPLPPEPAPAPPTPVVIPTDNAELNKFVASKLGGFSRANYDRNGVIIDIYQARGKQRVSWEVDSCENWMTAFVQAFVAKSATGSNNAGLALVCHCPDNPEPPVNPEPLPEPTPVVPTPAPEPLPIPDLNTPVQKKLYKFGGCPLVAAEAVCRAAGLWLVIVNDKTGDVNRVIYGNVAPQKVTWKAAKSKAKK